MGLEEPEFVNYARKMFSSNNSNYDTLVQRFTSTEERFEELSHFYYFICAPNKRDWEVRSELQLVGITSLIESMMQAIEYQGPFDYFYSTYPKQKGISDVKSFQKEYLSKFGASKKVGEYFRKYLADGADEMEFFGIQRWDRRRKDFVNLTKIKDIANFFYDARSDFVHGARMPGLLPPESSFSSISLARRHIQ